MDERQVVGLHFAPFGVAVAAAAAAGGLLPQNFIQPQQLQPQQQLQQVRLLGPLSNGAQKD